MGIETIVGEISNTLDTKGQEYEESVISKLPPEYWLAQIVIKAHRAENALHEEKMRDELLDTACYCILLIDKLDRGDSE